MAIYNIQVNYGQGMLTQSIANTLPGDIINYRITGSGVGDSYFTLETVRNSNGYYDNTSKKNTSGSFQLGTGIYGLIQNDQIASVIVGPNGGVLTFTPSIGITGSTLFLRGTGYK